MACIVKIKDKRSGLTYAYRSESYWDKEKKAPRSRRTLIGRVNPVTGEIEPTDGRRRRAMEKQQSESEDKEPIIEQNRFQGQYSQSDTFKLLKTTVEELRVLQESLARLTHCIEDVVARIPEEV